MIVLHIEAESLDELKGMVFRALGMTLKDKLDMLEPEVKPTKAKPAKPVKGVVAVEEPGPAPEEDFVVSVPGLDPEPEYVEVPVPAGNATAEAVELEKLKAETMILIQDMFAAGKVKAIRAVLDKHGGGAKSFPEIEAKEFPVINAALKAA